MEFLERLHRIHQAIVKRRGRAGGLLVFKMASGRESLAELEDGGMRGSGCQGGGVDTGPPASVELTPQVAERLAKRPILLVVRLHEVDPIVEVSVHRGVERRRKIWRDSALLPERFEGLGVRAAERDIAAKGEQRSRHPHVEFGKTQPQLRGVFVDVLNAMVEFLDPGFAVVN